MLDRDAIYELIPHRPPFLWVDRVLELEPGVRCVAVKFIDPAEPFFAGHFPGKAIVPGVLLIEAAAQTAGVMMGAPAANDKGERLLSSVNRFKFLKPVAPGSELRIETTKAAEVGPLVCIEASVEVSGDVVARGELSVYAA